MNCIKQRITTNVVTALKNEDTNEAIWHGRYHLGIKNSERPAKDHLWKNLIVMYQKMQLFVNHVLVGNSIKNRRQKESYQWAAWSCTQWCMWKDWNEVTQWSRILHHFHWWQTTISVGVYDETQKQSISDVLRMEKIVKKSIELKIKVLRRYSTWNNYTKNPRTKWRV